MIKTTSQLDRLSDHDLQREHAALSQPAVPYSTRWLHPSAFARWEVLDREMIRRGLNRASPYPRLTIGGIDEQGQPVPTPPRDDRTTPTFNGDTHRQPPGTAKVLN